MEINDMLSHAFARAEATQTTWNFYPVVVTAILAFLAAARAPVENRLVPLVLLLGFIAFATANLVALDNIRAQRVEILDIAAELAAASAIEVDKLLVTLKPPSRQALWLFHVILDVSVGVAILLVPYARRHSSPPNKGL